VCLWIWDLVACHLRESNLPTLTQKQSCLMLDRGFLDRIEPGCWCSSLRGIFDVAICHSSPCDAIACDVGWVPVGSCSVVVDVV
jgi:hypothetical protein